MFLTPTLPEVGGHFKFQLNLGHPPYFRRTSSDNDEAIYLYEIALELDAEYALAWASLARATASRPYRYFGDPAWADSALVFAERALELDPDLAEAHNAIGFVYGSRGWRQRAYEEYVRAWELDRSDNSTMNNIAASHLARGRLDEALTWYERAVRVDPTNTLYRSGMAFIYATIGDTARAVRLVRENLARQDPGGVQALVIQAGLGVLEDRDYDRALEIFEELVERDPPSADFRFEAAEAAFMVGNFERAIEHIGEARRLSPDALDAVTGSAREPRWMLLYGLALMQTGREDEGRGFLAELIQTRRALIIEGNEDASPWLDLTVAHAALGETIEALEAVDRAHQIARALVAGHLWRSETPYREALELTSLPSEPRFQAVLRQMEEDVAEMRRRIEVRQAGA